MSKTTLFNLISLKESILKILKGRRTSLNNKQIAWALNLKGSQYQKKISKAIALLQKEELIVETEKYKFEYNSRKKLIIGIIDINKSQHGYVNSGLFKDDIFIDRKNRLNSLNGDTVSINIIKAKKATLAGKVIEVIKRRYTKFIGTIKKDGNYNFFIPDNSKTGSDFFIPEEKLNGAQNNDRVIVEFIKWPTSAGCPFGAVIKILSNNIDLKNYINSTIETLNLRNSFSKKIDAELGKISPQIPSNELKDRRDFRKTTTFTIDPKDAKDFDDALSINFLPNKNIEIGIHIADVSHYVKAGSAIDNEAFLRAFSIYFPGKVIPMLPEELSNSICSLSPDEDKLSFSVVVEFNQKLCDFSSVWIGKGIINSNNRFTYEEVENIIVKGAGNFYKEIKILHKISKRLRRSRMESGSIDFQRSDIVFELNNLSEPIKVIEKPTLEAHKIVEEFMLIANKLVANKLSGLKKCIYRVHDYPDNELLGEVAKYLKQCGLKRVNFNPQNKKLPLIINKYITTPNSEINNNVFQNLILRAMAKANYSTKNIGHYGLGFKEYAHFTSPIRRYSDLIIHRFLEASINNKVPNMLNLDKHCAHFSNRERAYIDIERKTNKFIQLKLLENSVGEVFSGSISGLVKWGIYVELDDGKGEGLISTKDLLGDNYYYNDNLKAFIGRRGGIKYSLGQKVAIMIKSINLFKCEMDLRLV